MKTVGEIIHSARIKQDLSLDRLSHLTKIDIKYLEAIEKNDFDTLPSETFAKGFIRNIATRLDKNPDELIAIFRRDYRHQDSEQSLKALKQKRQHFSVEPSRLFPYLAGVTVFLVYLVFQFRAVLTPPTLHITKPENNAIIVSPVEVSGDTTVDSIITIDDLVVRPDENGHFSAKISLPIGETNLNIKTTNRFSRSTTKSVFFTIISK